MSRRHRSPTKSKAPQILHPPPNIPQIKRPKYPIPPIATAPTLSCHRLPFHPLPPNHEHQYPLDLSRTHIMTYPIETSTIYNMLIVHLLFPNLEATDCWRNKGSIMMRLGIYKDWNPRVQAFLSYAAMLETAL